MTSESNVPPTTGCVKVHIHGGDGFQGNTDFFDSKIYVIVGCGSLSGRTECKSTKRGTIVWNKEFKFNVSGRNDGQGIIPQFSAICFTVCSKKWLHDCVLAQQRCPLTTFDNNTSKYIPIRLSEQESVRATITLVGIDTRGLAQRTVLMGQTVTVHRTPAATERPPVSQAAALVQQAQGSTLWATRSRASTSPLLVQGSSQVTVRQRQSSALPPPVQQPKCVCTLDEIDRLTNEIPHDGYQRECSICLVECLKGEMVRVLPCFHVFHSRCVQRWLVQTGLCPLCKIHLTENVSPEKTYVPAEPTSSSCGVKIEVEEPSDNYSTSAPAVMPSLFFT